MGANGSHARGDADCEENRNWFTIYRIDDNTKLLQQKKGSRKLPEESHTPNRIYVLMLENGSDVKSIAQYGPDGKKIFEIHTDDHWHIRPHVHYWNNGGPLKFDDVNKYRLTPEMEELLRYVREELNC